MLPTPSTSHVNFENVYEPAEDSFLLIDTLSGATETAWLHKRFSCRCTALTLLEVGTGSGVVLGFVTSWAKKIFGRRDILTFGTDVNRMASQASARTVRQAVTASDEQPDRTTSAVFADTVMADLTSCMRVDDVDILIFNPPYVPTEELPDILDGEFTSDFERDSHLLALSYAGGDEGMETTNRLLDQLPSMLSPQRGVAYVLLCAQNKPKDVKARIRLWGDGWRAETVGDSGKKGGWEKLQIIRIWREP